MSKLHHHSVSLFSHLNIQDNNSTFPVGFGLSEGLNERAHRQRAEPAPEAAFLFSFPASARMFMLLVPHLALLCCSLRGLGRDADSCPETRWEKHVLEHRAMGAGAGVRRECGWVPLFTLKTKHWGFIFPSGFWIFQALSWP